jgi:predicted dehydrogenase
MKKVNWGIIGFGNAANSFINAIKYIPNVNLYGISSLSNYKNLLLKKKENNFLNLNVFNNHLKLLNNKNIDAVYIALTNNLHYEWIIKSLNYNKHVLTEKPSCENSVDYKDCMNLAKKKNLILTEAIMYRHHPQTLKVIEVIKSGIIGKVEKVFGKCGFDMGKRFLGFEVKKLNYDGRLLNKSLGGGAILDLGCYPLSMAILINEISNKNNTIPKIINTSKKIGKSKVDEISNIILLFPKKMYVYLEVAIRKKLNDQLLIQGSKGELNVPNPWLPSKNYILDLKLLNGEKKILKFECSEKLDYLFSYLIRDVSKAILLKKKLKYPSISNNETYAYLKIIDKWKIL